MMWLLGSFKEVSSLSSCICLPTSTLSVSFTCLECQVGGVCTFAIIFIGFIASGKHSSTILNSISTEVQVYIIIRPLLFYEMKWMQCQQQGLSFLALTPLLSASLTCQGLDARALEQASWAVLVVPLIIPAVVDRVAAAVLLRDLHVLIFRGHCRHPDLSPLTFSPIILPHQWLLMKPCKHRQRETCSHTCYIQLEQQGCIRFRVKLPLDADLGSV